MPDLLPEDLNKTPNSLILKNKKNKKKRRKKEKTLLA